MDCACREISEEANIVVNPSYLELCEILNFYFTNKPEDGDQQVYVYKTFKYSGVPKESDEMLPKFFKIKDVPYDNMWPDDKYWLPEVLNNKKVRASFTFGEDGSVVKKDKIVYFFN